MNQTFWMARSQTHNDHDASQSFSAFFSFSQYFFGHLPIFLRKPEVERLVNPDFLESNTISRWYQRIFSVSHPPGGILGFILWAVVINHSAKKCNFYFFHSFEGRIWIAKFTAVRRPCAIPHHHKGESSIHYYDLEEKLYYKNC